jgi:hypothetical protein
MNYVFGARGSVSPMRARGIRVISDNENFRWEIIFVVDYKTNHIYIYEKPTYMQKKTVSNAGF